MKNILVLLLVGAALLLAGLCMGAFAQLNPDIPAGGDLRPLVVIKNLESLVSGILPNLKDQAFSRGFVYMGLSVILSSLAAMLVADTRAEKIRRPGATGVSTGAIIKKEA